MTEPTSKTPGQEMDAAIARHVFGETVNRFPFGWKQGTLEAWNSIPHYSTDMTAAFRIVEKLGRERNWTLDLKVYGYGRTYAWFDHIGQDWASEGNGEHATAHAICLAALAALEAR